MTYWQEYYARNREKFREKAAAWYRTHPRNPEWAIRANASLAGRFSRLKYKAKMGGTHGGPPVECTLTFEQYAALVAEGCHYCGGELAPTGHGLDRKDPFGPYSIDNVVPCCWGCNRRKKQRSYEQFKCAS
jgi:hypothetical protein